ncbi:FadR/GntR family transcriptional regulator [Pelagibius sp.]|uniref:FadR/GntR family transcriptional regulator n=1 Tax=Pelagibius sp. TaxID=1931238 RepID=UPI003B50DA0F
MPVEAIQTKRLFQQVFEQLAKLIAAGEFPKGERLPAERDLARQLGVSRATVREAMIALELSGLVEVRVGSGIFVVATERQGTRPAASEPGGADPVPELGLGPFELIEARRLIEGQVAYLAAQQIQNSDFAALEASLSLMAEEHRSGFQTENGDRSFHVAIARATRNNALIKMVELLWDLREASPLWAKLHERVRAAQVRPASLDDHMRVLDALRAGDPMRARETMDAHLRRVADDLLRISEAEFAGEVDDEERRRGQRAVGR